MKTLKTLFFLFLLLILLVSCSEFQKPDKLGHAYIITVGIDYENVASRINKPSFWFTSLENPESLTFSEQSNLSQLPCCINDSDDIAMFFSAMYKEKGIESTVYNLNSKSSDATLFPTVQNVKTVLNTIKPNKNDIVLFYYSGHGVFEEEKALSYFCMGDNVQDEYGRANNVYLLPVKDVLTALAAKNCKVLAIFDDCETGANYFNDPVINGKISTNISFSNVSILASSSQEQTSAAGTFNSRFTDTMLSLLGWDCKEDKIYEVVPSCTLSQLVKVLRQSFSDLSQTPEINFTYADTLVIP